MAINFGDLSTTSTTPTEVTQTVGITLDMNKGDFLNLTKSAKSYSKIKLGAGWDVSNSSTAIDLDIAAFLLKNNKLTSNQDVIFFNNQDRGFIKLPNDNRTGAGDGDDEEILVALNDVPSDYNKIVFIVSIFEAQNRAQTFRSVNNSYIRLVDTETNEEIAKIQLKENFQNETGVIFAEMVRSNGEWVFHATNEGFIGDLGTLVNKYL